MDKQSKSDSHIKHVLSIDVTSKYHNVYNFTSLLRTYVPKDSHIEIIEYDWINNKNSLNELSINAIVISGSRFAVYNEYPWISGLEKLILKLYETEVPVLGVCFGHQIITKAFGGKVVKGKQYEYGIREFYLSEDGKKDELFKSVENTLNVLFSHNDYAIELPKQSILLGKSKLDGLSAFRLKNFWATQFHPELNGNLLSKLMQDQKEMFSKLFSDKSELEKAILDEPKKKSDGDKILSNFFTIVQETDVEINFAELFRMKE